MFALPSKSMSVFLPLTCGLLLVMGILWSISSLSASALIDVPGGDSNALVAAISTANESSEITTIRLDNSADYRFNLSASAPEPISSHIVLIGAGAHLVGEGVENAGRLFHVLEQGTLDLSDLVISDFSIGDVDASATQNGLITNEGVLLGKDLRFERIEAKSNSNRFAGGVITNYGGTLDFDRVRMVDVSVTDGATASVIAISNIGDARFKNLLIIGGKGHDPSATTATDVYISNFGATLFEMRNSSLIMQTTHSGAPTSIYAIGNAGGMAAHPRVTISGSMIVGLGCPFGTGQDSGGFNLVSDGCPSTSIGPNDLVGVSPGVLTYQLAADGGLELILPPNSPAIDAVTDPAFDCPARDAIRSIRPIDGNHDGIALCDIGAFESSGENQISGGGENGLFHSAGSDGHYVTIEEVRPNVFVIFWNTFDLDGNQAWVLALGNRVNDTITAEAYFQPDGKLVPGGGAAVDMEAQEVWGTVKLNLANCVSGTFTYDSDLPQFGSGSFSLNRLAFIEGVGCQDK